MVARLKRLRHIARMGDNVHYMNITFSQSAGSRKKGKSRLKWLDSVLKYLQTW
jgi:hypothetical protein